MNLVPPNEMQLEHIKKQDFYQSADQLDQDVTQLIEWMAKQPHLPKIKGIFKNNSKTLVFTTEYAFTPPSPPTTTTTTTSLTGKSKLKRTSA